VSAAVLGSHPCPCLRRWPQGQPCGGHLPAQPAALHITNPHCSTLPPAACPLPAAPPARTALWCTTAQPPAPCTPQPCSAPTPYPPACSAARKDGFAVHIYTASCSMDDSCLANADGDFLIVPQLVRACFAPTPSLFLCAVGLWGLPGQRRRRLPHCAAAGENLPGLNPASHPCQPACLFDLACLPAL